MALNSDNLIENFAKLLEEGEPLDSETFAKSAIEIIALVSIEPSLGDTLMKINAKLQSLIQSSKTIEYDAVSAKFCAAKEIRDLKKTAYLRTAEKLH